MKDAIAIFDIGKTNKKIILFDSNLKPLYQQEKCFPEICDEDGFACDDIDNIISWMYASLDSILCEKEFNIKALNFSTYGASLVYLDRSGKILTPVYNYLKPMPEDITEPIYKNFGGVQEFCRCTASPALGFLNSGLQALWLKKTRPDIFQKTAAILHFPQFWSYLFTGETTSEHTSIGCHTAMWDYDKMDYHPWLRAEGIELPKPVKTDRTFPSRKPEYQFRVGIGIHDSSSSLAPYIIQSKEKFVLISTGTWCINMNPFNHEALTNEQLKNDCLCYMSISEKPVKSSRLFMGHIHDVNMERIAEHFHGDKHRYKSVKCDENLLNRLSSESKCFFKNTLPESYVDASADLSGFKSFEEAYHRLIMDLTALNAKSINYILPENNDIQNIYISGGFSKNPIFISCMARNFPGKRIFTSAFDNSSALGAALVVYREFGLGEKPEIDLGLHEWIDGE